MLVHFVASSPGHSQLFKARSGLGTRLPFLLVQIDDVLMAAMDSGLAGWGEDGGQFWILG